MASVPLPRFDSVEAQLEAAMRTFHKTDPDNWAWELKPGTKAEKALELFRPLAAHGCAQAQYMMARMLWERDVERFMKWARRAAQQGHAGGQALLGSQFEREDKHREVLRWYRRAAKQGHVSVMHRLGAYYQTGRAVEEDYVQAYKWHALAIPRVLPDDRDYGLSYFPRSYYRDMLAKFERRMGDEEVARAKRLVEEWEDKHDEVRHFPADPEPPVNAWDERVEGGCDR